MTGGCGYWRCTCFRGVADSMLSLRGSRESMAPRPRGAMAKFDNSRGGFDASILPRRRRRQEEHKQSIFALRRHANANRPRCLTATGRSAEMACDSMYPCSCNRLGPTMPALTDECVLNVDGFV